MDSVPHMSRYQRSISLLKASWRALRADKELAVLPVIAGCIEIGIGALSLAALYAFVRYILHADLFGGDSVDLQINDLQMIIACTVIGFISYIVTNFFGVALASGALSRFRGQNPSISTSMSQAWLRRKTVVLFSGMQTTVGVILSLFENYVPFGGRLVATIGDMAWNIANFFSTPVIADAVQDLNPFDVTKQSVNLLRKTWGESLVTNIQLSLIFVPVMLIYFAIVTPLIVAVSIINGPIYWVALGLPAFTGLCLLALVFHLLDSYVRAAIYYYAATGEAPANFEKRVLQETLTVKQAKRIFG